MYQFDSRVRYSEVNSEQQLMISSMLDYLQDCCTFQSEDMGLGVDYLAKEQVAWVLSSWEIEILRYPKMGEKIQVGTWPSDFKGFYGYRNFLLKGETEDVLAKANSLWVFMDTEKMRPMRVKDTFVEAYGRILEPALEGDWSDRKIIVPDKQTVMEPVQVAKFFIDTNHHMNNGKYVLVAEEYLPEDFKVGRLKVEYKKAAVLGDVLYPAVTLEEDVVTVVLGDEAGRAYAVVQFMKQ